MAYSNCFRIAPKGDYYHKTNIQYLLGNDPTKQRSVQTIVIRPTMIKFLATLALLCFSVGVTHAKDYSVGVKCPQVEGKDCTPGERILLDRYLRSALEETPGYESWGSSDGWVSFDKGEKVDFAQDLKASQGTRRLCNFDCWFWCNHNHADPKWCECCECCATERRMLRVLEEKELPAVVGGIQEKIRGKARLEKAVKCVDTSQCTVEAIDESALAEQAAALEATPFEAP